MAVKTDRDNFLEITPGYAGSSKRLQRRTVGDYQSRKFCRPDAQSTVSKHSRDNHNCSNGILAITSCAGGRNNISPAPVTLTFDPLTLKVVSESRVTWATCANFSLPRSLCSRLRPDVRDTQTNRRQTDVRKHHRLMPLPRRGQGHNNQAV